MMNYEDYDMSYQSVKNRQEENFEDFKVRDTLPVALKKVFKNGQKNRFNTYVISHCQVFLKKAGYI